MQTAKALVSLHHCAGSPDADDAVPNEFVLIFDMSFRLHQYFVYASIEGADKSVPLTGSPVVSLTSNAIVTKMSYTG